MNQLNKYGFIFLTLLLLIGCSKNTTEGFEKWSKKKNVELINVLDSMSAQSFEYFYLKIQTKYEDSTMNISFKTTIRFIEDSALNTLVTWNRIPIMNSIVTPDSVFVSDKREKCYIKQSMDYFKNSFGVDFNFKNIEELAMGLPLDYDRNLKHYQLNSRVGYVLSTHRKRDIRKIEKKGLKEVFTKYTLSRDLKELKSIEIYSPEDTTTIYIDYNTRQYVDGYLLPKEVTILVVTPGQKIKTRLNYKKIRVNEPETIHFVIPEKYEECK